MAAYPLSKKMEGKKWRDGKKGREEASKLFLQGWRGLGLVCRRHLMLAERDVKSSKKFLKLTSGERGRKSIGHARRRRDGRRWIWGFRGS